jgi:hypothetical protein
VCFVRNYRGLLLSQDGKRTWRLCIGFEPWFVLANSIQQSEPRHRSVDSAILRTTIAHSQHRKSSVPHCGLDSACRSLA